MFGPTSPFFRLHHIQEFISLESEFKRWTQKPSAENPFSGIQLAQVSDRDDARHAFLEYYTIHIAESVQQGIQQAAWNIRDSNYSYWVDYAGYDGKNATVYVDSMVRIFDAYLSIHPATEIYFTYTPDSICEACTTKAFKSTYGRHCVEPKQSHADFIWEQSLLDLSGRYESIFSAVSPIARNQTDQGPVISLSKQHLLDTKFNFQLSSSYIHIQRFLCNEGEYEKLLHANILQYLHSIYDRGYCVTEAYLRGEARR